MKPKVKIVMLKGEKGDAGTSGDYTELDNKPQINGVTVAGNVSADDLGLASATELDEAIAGIEGGAVYLRLLDANEFEYSEALIGQKTNEVITERIKDDTISPTMLYSSKKISDLISAKPRFLTDRVTRHGTDLARTRATNINGVDWITTHKLTGSVRFVDPFEGTDIEFGAEPCVDISCSISGIEPATKNSISSISCSAIANSDCKTFSYEILITIVANNQVTADLNNATIEIDWGAIGKE